MKNLSEFIKRKQQLLAIAAVLVIVVLVIIIMKSMSNNQEPALEPVEEMRIITPGKSGASAEEVWRHKMEAKHMELTKLLQEIQTELKTQQDKEAAFSAQMFREPINNKPSGPMATITAKDDVVHQSDNLFQFDNNQNHKYVEPIVNIKKIKLNLTGKTEAPTRKTIENTIPAGAFARAVLLSGVDANTAITSQADPRPVLLRIIDAGTLPRQFKSDLLDCHCTASGYGDLSSERFHARLEKLTCVERSTGEIIETEVAGHVVSGMDGREGIRGVVVSKEGAFLSRSLWGGVFSGIGKAISPSTQRSYINPFSAANPTINTPNTAELFKSGMADSAAQSLDRLAQYYIDRAEQVQPVIQVAAGQPVDIVFTNGSFIGGTLVKNEIEKSREKHRKKAAKLEASVDKVFVTKN